MLVRGVSEGICTFEMGYGDFDTRAIPADSVNLVHCANHVIQMLDNVVGVHVLE